jgi:aminoglycoside 3-N-acetyltransferase
MGERAAIDRVDEPVTRPTLVEDLRALGLSAGETVLVHSSLSALGWIAGGAQTVVDALRTVLTDEGTLVMPTHTPQYTDPGEWSNPPVPAAWVDAIRDSMPAFRPSITPTRGMGAVPECFRNYPDVVRSAHPEVSFAAWGADAEGVVGDHALDFGLGESSPLAEIYQRGGSVLLLGVGHETNTSLHLAEYRADLSVPTVTNRVPVRRDGERVRVSIEDIETSTDDFPEVGAAFEREVGARRRTVGAADATLLDQRSLVDFAVEYFEATR